MRGANNHPPPPHCLGVARWSSLLSPSRGADVTRSTLVVGRLGYQGTSVIISPPRPRHAHAGRRTPADHRTPTAAEHRPHTDRRTPMADGDAATAPPAKHPPPPFSLSPLRVRGHTQQSPPPPYCRRRERHRRRRRVADTKPHQYDDDTCQTGHNNKRRLPGKGESCIQAKKVAVRYSQTLPAREGAPRYESSRAPPPRSAPFQLWLAGKSEVSRLFWYNTIVG